MTIKRVRRGIDARNAARKLAERMLNGTNSSQKNISLGAYNRKLFGSLFRRK